MACLHDDYISACEGVARREPRPLSQKSLLNIHTDLCALYTWATSPGIELAATHIFHTIERPEADTPVIETFTREQIRDMLKACKQHHSRWQGTRAREETACRVFREVHRPCLVALSHPAEENPQTG